MRRSRLVGTAALIVGVVLVGAGCGSSSKGASSGGSETSVKLTDYAMTADPPTVKAGDVKVTAVNDGNVTHEVVVVRATAASSLPTKSDGSVDEEKIAESAKQGEVEDVAAGTTKSSTLTLEPGSYVVFCNVIDGSGPNAIRHFKQGMHATLTVTAP